MKLTLLQAVQSILSDMDSDEVNAYDDTVESLQVAKALENAYYYILSFNELPEHKALFTLTALGDTNKPSHMQVPSSVMRVDWIQYDTQTATDTRINWTDIDYLEPHDFLNYISGRDSSASTVQTVLHDGSNLKLLIKNDAAPSFWTSFDDEYVVFDSFDSGVDSTLQANKTMASGLKLPTFTLSDNFTPDMDEHMFQLWLNEAKQQCFVDFKQQSNPIAQQRARKLLTKHEQREHRLLTPNYTGPDYGRRR